MPPCFFSIYLGEVLGFDAVDRTSEEVLRDLAARGAAAAIRDTSRGFLEACDVVKFAKHRPGRDEIDATVERGRKLLDLARPRPEATPAAAVIGEGATP